MRTLEAKRVLITGAGSGIGRALALECARAGAAVLAVDLDPAAAQETARACPDGRERARAYQCDVASPPAIAALRERIHADGGPIDVLVNNAGIVHGGPFLDVPLHQHLATLAVNLSGVVAATHAFLPDLLGRAEGHLVNLASASALVGLPFGTTYAASKWAVVGFSESLRLELAALGHHHVGVTAVCPSYVATGLFEGARAPRTTRMLTPDRVARLTVKAILRNRPLVLVPWLVKITPPLKAVLPRRWFEAIAGVLGVSSSMRQWRGRNPAP